MTSLAVLFARLDRICRALHASGQHARAFDLRFRWHGWVVDRQRHAELAAILSQMPAAQRLLFLAEASGMLRSLEEERRHGQRGPRRRQGGKQLP